MKLALVLMLCLLPIGSLSQTSAPPAPQKEQDPAQKDILDLIRNLPAFYDRRETFTANAVVKFTQGKDNGTATINIRVTGDGKRYITRGSMVQTLEINEGKTKRSISQTKIIDGKTLTILYTDDSQYAVVPNDPQQISDIFADTFTRALKMGLTYTPSARTIGGKKWGVLTGKGAMGEVEIVLDVNPVMVKSVKVTSTSTTPATVIEVTLSDQEFNSPLPDLILNIPIPKGYVKVPEKKDP